MVKNLPAMQETRVWLLGGEDPLEKEMATHSIILAWRIPWTEESGRLQSMLRQRVGQKWATEHTYAQVPICKSSQAILLSTKIMGQSMCILCFHLTCRNEACTETIQSIQASQKSCEYFFHFLTRQWPLKVICSFHRGVRMVGWLWTWNF